MDEKSNTQDTAVLAAMAIPEFEEDLDTGDRPETPDPAKEAVEGAPASPAKKEDLEATIAT